VFPRLQPAGTIEATSFCDTGHLKATLERLVDLDRRNADSVRFSIGAVNVRSGNFIYFDTATHTIRPEQYHGERRAPTRFSRDRNRRRALLGRRPRFDHSAAVGGRWPLPYTDDTLDHVCTHIDQAQMTLGRQILLENPSVRRARP
jgi:Protein of unknown function (DUF692)